MSDIINGSCLKQRKYISRGCFKKNFSKFLKLQKDYYEDIANLVGAEKFVKTLDHMFHRFVSQNNEVDPKSGEIVPSLHVEVNFDTGDAGADPFPEFIFSIKKQVENVSEYKKYYGPQAKNELKIAIKEFLCDQNLISAEIADNFDVVLGCGSVNIYDAICRKIIKRKDDAIIIPAPTYGFFIPQIYRMKGEVIFIIGEEGGKVSPLEVHKNIQEYNVRQHLIWKSLLEEHFRIYLSHLTSKLCQKFILDKKQFSIMKEQILASKDIFETDRIVSIFVQSNLLGKNARLIKRIFENSDLLPPSPSRVVGFLHINPSIYGAAYTQDDINALTNIFEEMRVTVIEDLAYFPVKSQKAENLASFLPKDCETISLLGISKPFALAGFRIGIAVTKSLLAEDLMRRIENIIGFTPMSIQKAVIDMLSTKKADIKYYFDQNNFSARGYAFKRKIMIFGLEGRRSKCLSYEDKITCESVYRAEIKNLFQKKRQQGIELFDKDYLLKSGVDINSLSQNDNISRYEQLIVEDFLERGVSEWFDLSFDPIWGFFSIVNCEKLISCSPIVGINLNNSFDVFAFLAFFFGFRTIPSETMGIENPRIGQHKLRCTYSSKIETIVSGLFTIFVGINQLLLKT